MSLDLLFVARSTPEHVAAGGLERVSWDLAAGLAQAHNVSMLTTPIPNRPVEFVLDGVRVITIPGVAPGRYSIKWWLKSAQRRSQNFDIVFSVSAGAASMALRRGPRFVFQAHGTAFAELLAVARGRPRLWALKLARLAYWVFLDNILYRRADAVVAVGPQVVAKLQHAAYRRAWHRTALIEIVNGVRSEPTGPTDAMQTGIKAITVSRLTRQKGTDRCLSAIPHCGSQVTLQVVGDGEEAENLQAQATSLELGGRVTFNGPATHAEVLTMLRASTTFIFPSRDPSREGLPLVVLEALAMGLAVIVPHDSVWPPDLDGLLRRVDMADPVALASAISTPPTTHEHLMRLPQRYTLAGMVKNYDQLLRDLDKSYSRPKRRPTGKRGRYRSLTVTRDEALQ